MKKLLALSIALLSLNLYGAETSFHGLEGWGKKNGVSIEVVDYSKQDKTFDKKAIANQVELKLRLAGIKVIENRFMSRDYLLIDMQPNAISGKVIGYTIHFLVVRRMTFKYDGKEYQTQASTPVDYGGTCPQNYRNYLDKHLDRILLNYLKANPKPKEKKSLKEP